MRRLSELGISPTPWSISDSGTVDSNGIICANCITKPEAHANKLMITASPDMYDALWEQCFGDTTTVNCSKCEGNDHGIERCSKTCPLYKSRMALAKASGMIIKE